MNQRESLNVQDTTSYGQPTQESIGEEDDSQTLVTFTRPLAKSCIQRDLSEHFPGNHVHVSRPDNSFLSDGPVFADSCELDQPSYPVNPSLQPDHLVQHFSAEWHSAKFPQQLAISPANFAHYPSHKVILLMPVQQNGHIPTSKTGIALYFLMCKMSSSTLWMQVVKLSLNTHSSTATLTR